MLFTCVQDDPYDYYNWDPKKAKWQQENFRKFVEIYEFNPDLTDKQLATKLKNWRLVVVVVVVVTSALSLFSNSMHIMWRFCRLKCSNSFVATLKLLSLNFLS